MMAETGFAQNVDYSLKAVEHQSFYIGYTFDKVSHGNLKHLSDFIPYWRHYGSIEVSGS